MNARPEKTAVESPTASSGSRFAYRDVVRALQTDEARRLALGLYRRAGYSAKDFGLRRAARVAMTEALTSTEDALELRGVRREREAIRGLRRHLESELWP